MSYLSIYTEDRGRVDFGLSANPVKMSVHLDLCRLTSRLGQFCCLLIKILKRKCEFMNQNKYVTLTAAFFINARTSLDWVLGFCSSSDML